MQISSLIVYTLSVILVFGAQKSYPKKLRLNRLHGTGSWPFSNVDSILRRLVRDIDPANDTSQNAEPSGANGISENATESNKERNQRLLVSGDNLDDAVENADNSVTPKKLKKWITTTTENQDDSGVQDFALTSDSSEAASGGGEEETESGTDNSSAAPSQDEGSTHAASKAEEKHASSSPLLFIGVGVAIFVVIIVVVVIIIVRSKKTAGAVKV
uniref:Uncharacterized protein n=1 Tax=Romanomermis culicivorax TaxID=13658 RepID=A0A915KIK8_ROMCU